MISDLIGKTLREVIIKKSCYKQEDMITFVESGHKGKKWVMFHDGDCCEEVYIDDICGDLGDLVGSEILTAEEVTNQDEPKNKHDDSFTWTFYKISTAKGFVTIKWYGTSNGYYSESVRFELATQ